MSNNQNLESLYNSELKPRLTELNNQRADIVNKIKKFAFYSIVPIIISIFVSIEIQFPIPTIVVVGLSVLISFIGKLSPKSIIIGKVFFLSNTIFDPLRSK